MKTLLIVLTLLTSLATLTSHASTELQLSTKDLLNQCAAGVSKARGINEWNRCQQIENVDLKKVCFATLEGSPSYCEYLLDDNSKIDLLHLCAAGVSKARGINEWNRCQQIENIDLKKVCFATLEGSPSYCEDYIQ